ncbi:MAG: hypothetical protein ABFS34_15375 [Gemmatimonadota bacterium]
MNMRTALSACVLVASLLAGCRVGGGYDEAAVAAGLGSQVRLELAEGEMRGELLLARPDGIVLLQGARAFLAPWAVIEKLSFSSYPVEDHKGGIAPSSVQRRQMQLASRYPHGLTDSQLAELLAALDQAELERLQ